MYFSADRLLLPLKGCGKFTEHRKKKSEFSKRIRTKIKSTSTIY